MESIIRIHLCALYPNSGAEIKKRRPKKIKTKNHKKLRKINKIKKIDKHKEKMEKQKKKQEQITKK